MATTAKAAVKETPAAQRPRRRPQQSRARQTAQAIREAFEQGLLESGYERLSIRQITSLAGVGIGSFYEYYASKSELASVCVHLRVKQIRTTMAKCLDKVRELPLPQRVDALLAAQTGAALEQPALWRALFLLERQLADIRPYRKQYAEFVRIWQSALQQGADWPATADLGEAAFAVHAISYSLTSQALMTSDQTPDAARSQQRLRQAVHGYLAQLAPKVYRRHPPFG